MAVIVLIRILKLYVRSFLLGVPVRPNVCQGFSVNIKPNRKSETTFRTPNGKLMTVQSFKTWIKDSARLGVGSWAALRKRVAREIHRASALTIVEIIGRG